MTTALTPILEWSPTTTPFQTPVWVDITSRLISHKTQSSHRQSTIGRFEVGTSEFVLDNPARAFEPYYAAGTYYPNVRRRKRIRLRCTDGTTIRPVVDHFIERIAPTYPANGLDAEVTFTCSDLLALIADDELAHPYVRAVLGTAPLGYYRLNEASGATVAVDESGSGYNLTYNGSPTFGQPDPITDDVDGAVTFPSGSWIGGGLGAQTMAAFSIAVWFQHAAVTWTDLSYLIAWTTVDGFGNQVTLRGTSLSGPGTIGVNTVGGGYQTAARYDDNAWHFLVVTSDSTNGHLYIDGADVSGAFGSVGPHLGGQVTIGGWPLSGASYSFGGQVDEPAFWTRVLTPTEVSTIYAARTAGLADTTGGRIVRVADYTGIPAGLRSFATGISTMTSAGDMEGQSAVEAMRLAEETESGWLFVDRSGVLTFLDRHAPQGGVSRCSTAQANFGTGVGRTGPSEIAMDDDVMEMANVVKNIGRNTATVTVTNPTSVTNNGRISRTLNTAPQSATDVTMRAQWEAALRAEPVALRINRLGFDVAVDNAAAVMGREVMDLVNVSWTPPGGGVAISQDTLVQGIETASEKPWDFWQVTFDLSATDTVGMFIVGVSTVGGPDLIGF
jgi:concanavalin A-like lectin/glucanase superfamily protein